MGKISCAKVQLLETSQHYGLGEEIYQQLQVDGEALRASHIRRD